MIFVAYVLANLASKLSPSFASFHLFLPNTNNNNLGQVQLFTAAAAMASPPSQSLMAGTVKKEPRKQVTFRFCSECSNMLYPKEDEDTHTLQFTCRTCQYTEEAKSPCIFRNVINSAQGETAGVTTDVGSDPTVGAAPFRIDLSSVIWALN